LATATAGVAGDSGVRCVIEDSFCGSGKRSAWWGAPSSGGSLRWGRLPSAGARRRVAWVLSPLEVVRPQGVVEREPDRLRLCRCHGGGSGDIGKDVSKLSEGVMMLVVTNGGERGRWRGMEERMREGLRSGGRGVARGRNWETYLPGKPNNRIHDPFR
jgi:hypothetical protein